MISSIHYARELQVRYEADVAVLGGGMAGVCAAAAAARSGATVILVERFATLGGMMTTGGVNNFCGESQGQGEVFDELLAGLEAFGAVAPYEPYRHFVSGNRSFEQEILMVVMQEVLLKRGVKLLLHTRFVDVCTEDGRITACVVSGVSGPEALRARHFIDTTGEAEVAHAAGCASLKGRPGDGRQLPMSMMYFVRHLAPGQARPQVPPGWFDQITRQEDLPMVSPWPNGPGSSAIKVKVPGFDSTDTESLSAAEIRGRQRMMSVLDYYQRTGQKPWHFDHASPIIGIREGRRVVGNHILTEAEVRAGQRFADGVAMGTFYLDAHDPTTEKRVAQITEKKDREVPPYQIPLRALYARDCANLWIAGRCMSADALAHSSARVSTSCAMMGQAVGVAAALASRTGLDARAVDAQAVRQVLLERNAILER